MIKKILLLIAMAMTLASTIGAQGVPLCFPCDKPNKN